MKYFFQISLFFFPMAMICGQSDYGKAYTKAQESVKLMDNGKPEEGLKLMLEAEKLDPDNIVYSFEIGYCYAQMKQYKKTIEKLEQFLEHKDVSDQFYQLVGNCYDYSGEREKAKKMYDKGLQKFPNSGKLYLEKGNLFLIEKDYEKALPLYEKGIEVDPSFPSNYHHAARLYCNSDLEVWGLFYGEIFMNLEPNSKRTVEISKLLYDTYNQGIQFSGDFPTSVSFWNNVVYKINNSKTTGEPLMPFGSIYELTIMLASFGIKGININSLDSIRTNFIAKFFEAEKLHKFNPDDYPNIVLDYHKKLIAAGHFEAYNHWLLMQGDSYAFK